MSIIRRIVMDFDQYDQAFSKLGPAGYTIAINITNIMPEVYHTTLPDEWVAEYTRNQYLFLDPVMQFTMFSSGVSRWDEIKSLKVPWLSNRVAKRAAEFNLRYGGAVVKKTKGKGNKTHLLSVARGDRQLTDIELRELEYIFEDLLIALQPNRLSFSERQLQVVSLNAQGLALKERHLQILSLIAQGLTVKEVSVRLGWSPDTVKSDIVQIRSILKAKNITEAIGIAISMGIIDPYDQSS